MAPHPREPGIDVRAADAAYRGFPSFSQWLSSTSVDGIRWDRYSSLLQKRKDLTPELLAKARDVAKRAAAIDTGAIEGLYEVTRGFTESVALQTATWEAQLNAKGEAVRTIIEAQMSAYDFVLDFVTRAIPVAEAWIRVLHEVICAGQSTYKVHTGIGLQDHRLPLGQYKSMPNHVRKPDGSVHSYCPVDLVPAEMQRMCAELDSDGFRSAHPVQQASYAHYAFVAIHPFADGNGRVARALASVYAYRALSVPIVILMEHRADYFSSLELADAGSYQPFASFILERMLDSIQFVSETLQAAGMSAPEAAAELKRLYVTKGGLTQAEVDAAGLRLLEAFRENLSRHAAALRTSELDISIDQSSTWQFQDPAYRLPLTASGHSVCVNLLRVALKAAPPTKFEVNRDIVVVVPKDSGREDDLRLLSLRTDDVFEARVSEAHPGIAGTVLLRLSVFAEGLLGRAIRELTQAVLGRKNTAQ